MDGSLDIPESLLPLVANFPLMQPPPGVKSDPRNRKFQGQPVLISATICFPIIVIFGLLRVYGKHQLLKKWGALDDYAFVVSFITGVAVMAMNISFTYSGAFGYHMWDITVGDLTKSALMQSLILPSLTALVLWIIKFSLFCLILNSFRPVTWLRRLCYVGIVGTLPVHIAGAIIYAVGCGPRGGYGRASLMAGLARCRGPGGLVMTYNVAQGAFHVFSDFYLLLIPIPAILKLHLPRRKKIGVFLIFFSGFAACVMSIVALIYRIRCFKEADTIYLQIFVLTVTNIEMAVGIAIPCMGPAAKTVQHFYTTIKLKYGLIDSEKESVTIGSGGVRQPNGASPGANGATYGQSEAINRITMDWPVRLHGPDS
ncbi:hypothetical protein CC78DRAFT_621089 [Lojkania enalia]|uniref:Rhodopsin domain-containing protein n=1 Tax=Lojkania enalia TaxID=147567 RepID=A0A9P4K246_9PLEO|nr:hypothetical protein CC78DRAFT_621089 [Didymosphaeria enalia]